MRRSGVRLPSAPPGFHRAIIAEPSADRQSVYRGADCLAPLDLGRPCLTALQFHPYVSTPKSCGRMVAISRSGTQIATEGERRLAVLAPRHDLVSGPTSAGGRERRARR